MFFLDADQKVYSRYGQRNAKSADALQSLKGLSHTMQSVLKMHGNAEKAYAPRTSETPVTIREIGGRSRRCYHCHNVQEVLNQKAKNAGKWDRDKAFRFPLPEVLGLSLEVDRGNVVSQVAAGSPAAEAGLQKGDVVRVLGGVPVHSVADAQFGLDRAPAKGSLALVWERAGKAQTGSVVLKEGWRQEGDLSWRPSLRRQLASLPIYGTDLTADEKKKHGLPSDALAVRQRDSVHSRASAMGVKAGDVILGIDERTYAGSADGFRKFVSGRYLIGDRAKLHVLREGRRLALDITFR